MTFEVSRIGGGRILCWHRANSAFSSFTVSLLFIDIARLFPRLHAALKYVLVASWQGEHDTGAGAN